MCCCCAPTRASNCLHLHAAVLLNLSLGRARMRSGIAFQMVLRRLGWQLVVKQSGVWSQIHTRVASMPFVAELGNNAFLNTFRVMRWMIAIGSVQS